MPEYTKYSSPDSMILFLEFHAIYSKVVWYKSAKPKVIEKGLVKQCQMVFYIICLVTVKNAKDSSLGNLGLVQ